MDTSVFWPDEEPTPADLAKIEREWPSIEAALAELDAEIAALEAEDRVSESGRRRVRRAEQRSMRRAVVVAFPSAGSSSWSLRAVA